MVLLILDFFVATAFLALTLWSIKLSKEFKPLKGLREEDFRIINEFGTVAFMPPKAVQMFGQLPRLLSVVALIGTCGFIVSFLGALIQLFSI